MGECVSCSKTLVGNQQKYCGNTCKQRAFYHKERPKNNPYFNQTWRGYKRKLHLIDLRGGGCETCGYNKNLSALEFHHKDAGTKESQLDIRALSNASMEFIMNEFHKCMVLCAICHRELHSPHLITSYVREQIKNKADVDKLNKHIVRNGKPKCIDCGIEVNYTYKRCRPCKCKSLRITERPDIHILKAELEEHGVTWCAAKYKVARRSIKRWLKG